MAEEYTVEEKTLVSSRTDQMITDDSKSDIAQTAWFNLNRAAMRSLIFT